MAADKSHNPDELLLDDEDSVVGSQIPCTNNELRLDADESDDDFSLQLDDSEKEEDSLGFVPDEDDPSSEAIRDKLNEMQVEQQKLTEIQQEMERELQSVAKSDSESSFSSSFPTAEEKAESDTKSVYVGNVDYSITAEELAKHFESCGPVSRATIMCNKYSGKPKGFAYVEFKEKDFVDSALKLDESLLRGRPIKVQPKRTNKPGLTAATRPRGSAHSGRGRGYSRGGSFYSMFLPMQMPPMMVRGRGRGRPRSNWYTPY